MVRNTQTAGYDAPAVYLPDLIDWATRQQDRASALAAHHMRTHETYWATKASAEAAEMRHVAEWARTRLEDISESALTELEQEPPRTLVGLTDWLVALLGRYFPGLPREGWQTVAYWLHCWRPQP